MMILILKIRTTIWEDFGNNWIDPPIWLYPYKCMSYPEHRISDYLNIWEGFE